MMGVTGIERDLAVHKRIVVQPGLITHLNEEAIMAAAATAATITTTITTITIAAVTTIGIIHAIRDITTMTTIGQTRYVDRSFHYDDPRHHHHPPHPQRLEDQGPAKPNINVVLRSLPDKATEQDIHKTLEDMEGSVDEVTLIRDRDTGESRKFAFVRFTSVGHAVQFVEKHYPHFYMGHHRVRIDYCQKDGSRTSKSEWRCPTCGKFNDESRRTCVECRSMVHEGTRAQKRSKETESMAINDGTSDVSQMASNMLLLQNLDHLSSEESVFNAVKEYQGIQRVLLIKDKLTRMSCEFAFVDFVNVQCAVTAMRQMNSQGFKVDGRAPKVSFGSPDSFLPAYAASEWTVQADVADGLWMYHDEHAYASEYSLRLEQERAEKEEQEKRLAAERKMKQEETSKSKDPLEDDLSAFYAGMGSILSSDDKKESTEDIFSVPKI
ncbi:rna-directed rna polymerase 2 [Lichtheimia corymbifera JMRC:FSU:9682]|uniref:Rna-directed rna polymerase 2 n=1 Tax=Lichtheimia corymbifera JMRC:FSU:9682 TaxID=1263082 RepID=A0A068RJA0_9FUNG|nr:rna-directed rna polymerase 2 [Lichtheimia corymbifera JMRC:FSU:9682]